jgi:alpha-tubulin suppressor-like RCC1 family protein
VQVSGLTGVVAIARSAGEFHSLALKGDGTVWTWGWNNAGQLGDGTTVDSNVPVQVSTLTNVLAISGGAEHSIALKNDGSVWAWGLNGSGQLGVGSTAPSAVPVQVSALGEVIAIAGGGAHSLALENNGTVWTWGDNTYGALGNGSNTTSTVPVPVNALTGITAIAACAHSLALKNDGTLWAWGQNWSGELGNGSSTDSDLPIQVTGLCAVANEVEEHGRSALNLWPDPAVAGQVVTLDLAGARNAGLMGIYDVEGRTIPTMITREVGRMSFSTAGLRPGCFVVHVVVDGAHRFLRLVIA